MNPESGQPLRLGPAATADEPAVLGLLLAHLDADTRARTLRQLATSGADEPPGTLWAAYRGERLVGALRATTQAGRTALITPLGLVADEPDTTAQRLLACVLENLRDQQVQMVQAVVESDRRADIERLVVGGFRYVANLLYLVSTTAEFPDAPPTANLEFVPYRPAEHERLARLVERTYEGSLDCPALEAVRSVDDVLAGYRASGAFDPQRWLVARHLGRDVGCLLLADVPESRHWELTYMGVVPEARGRGFGLALAREAQWRARSAGCKRLVLAVDEANTPAKKAYAAAGFAAWDARLVLVFTL